ncbi:hypothetical protein TWF217_004138 [Orbilia oligospora]|nr:hypothetical protein TWF217_004138 [Orbilia oligospora]
MALKTAKPSNYIMKSLHKPRSKTLRPTVLRRCRPRERSAVQTNPIWPISVGNINSLCPQRRLSRPPEA